MNIKTTLKSSVAVAALFATALPVAMAPGSAEAGEGMTMEVSGEVRKAIWYGDDGTRDAIFISDNNTDESRLRWVASGDLNESVSIGALIGCTRDVAGGTDGPHRPCAPCGARGGGRGARPRVSADAGQPGQRMGP